MTTRPAATTLVDVDALTREILTAEPTLDVDAKALAQALLPYLARQLEQAALGVRPAPAVEDTGPIRVTDNGLILAGNTLVGDLVEPSWRRRLVACVNHFAGVATDRIEAMTARQAAVEAKPLRDALFRAVSAARGHRDMLFREDGDVIESYLRHGLADDVG